VEIFRLSDGTVREILKIELGAVFLVDTQSKGQTVIGFFVNVPRFAGDILRILDFRSLLFGKITATGHNVIDIEQTVASNSLNGTDKWIASLSHLDFGFRKQRYKLTFCAHGTNEANHFESVSDCNSQLVFHYSEFTLEIRNVKSFL